MSAATSMKLVPNGHMDASVLRSVQANLPGYKKALAYWDEFTLQCRRQVKAINAVASEHDLPETAGVQWKPGSLSVALAREAYPSTEVRLNLIFEHWGPKISGSVQGNQEEEIRFYPEEFELAIGCDQDDQVVAITHDGGSLSPHEFAKYVAQNFRRCYPGISLPCPDGPLE
jgi:hypothetical protein